VPFHVIGDRPPALFIALDGFIRGPQEYGHLLLGLTHFLPDLDQFFAFHETGLIVAAIIDKIPRCGIYVKAKKCPSLRRGDPSLPELAERRAFRRQDGNQVVEIKAFILVKGEFDGLYQSVKYMFKLQ
jgi:hypothetical protein